jgi:hypothetical protein
MRIGYSWEGSAWPTHRPATGSCDPATVEGSFSRGCFFQNGRRRLRSARLFWRKVHSRTPYPSAKPMIRAIVTSSIATSAQSPQRDPQRVTQLKGRVSGTPRSCFYKRNAARAAGFLAYFETGFSLSHNRSGARSPCFATQYSAWRAAWLPVDCDPLLRVCATAASNAADINDVLWPKRIIAGGMVGSARSGSWIPVKWKSIC